MFKGVKNTYITCFLYYEFYSNLNTFLRCSKYVGCVVHVVSLFSLIPLNCTLNLCLFLLSSYSKYEYPQRPERVGTE